MADTPPYFPSVSPSNACKCIQKVINGGSSFPSSLYSLDCTQSKRKRSFVDGCSDGSSLSLGLGCSGVTMFSGKETEENSSGNLDLTMSLHTQSVDQVKPSRTERLEVDLELSLAGGSIESDVTAITQPSFPFMNTTSALTSAGVQLVDEGSTSSKWKLPLLPPFLTADPAPLLHNLQGYNRPNLIIPTASSSLDSGSIPFPPQNRRTGNVKECRFTGCTRGARGASGFCISHGGGRRCQRGGCQKGAEGKTVFCKAHGGGRRCEFLGCTKSAEGRTDYCIGHGGGRRCSHNGCTHAARGKSGLCIRHGGGKRCKHEGCTKSAEGISGLCISHGGGRRCHFPACTKGAQGSTLYCKAHGGGKRCTFLGCTKGAEGSTSFCKGHGGGKRCTFEGGCSKSVHGGTLFCVNHGGGKRCAVAECTKSARGRTSFCVRHGGGKRCQYGGCGKSAQGRTDFCKAHGGGRRCSWEQSGGRQSTPCDKFARGKTGLCVSHSQVVEDDRIPGVMVDQPPPGYGDYSLPEGRVHGGSLMAMLRGCTSGSGSGPVGSPPMGGGRWV